jgi:hypothetical protein
MKIYYLDVVIGTGAWPNHYEVKADTYGYSEGCYTFYIRDGRNNPTIVVASYPIDRTIIKRIEEI